MKLIRFLYNLIYKAFTGDLSACNAKVVCSEVEKRIVQPVIENNVIEVGDGIDREPVTGEGKVGSFYGILQKPDQKMHKVTGVYQLICLVDNMRYIGSTGRSISQRYSRHMSGLRDGRHENQYLQNAFIKHGVENFRFEIVEICSKEKCIEREQYYIDYYGINNLYNLNPLAHTSLGCKRTPGKGRKNYKASAETLKKMSDCKKGQVAWNKDTKGTGIMKPNKTSFKSTVPFELVSPDEKYLYKGIGYASFAKQVGIDAGNLRCLIFNENYYSCSGWTLPENGKEYIVIEWHDGMEIKEKFNLDRKFEKFEFVSSDGVLYKGSGVTFFAKEFNIYIAGLNKVKTGKLTSHKGWTKPIEGKIYEKVVNWKQGMNLPIPFFPKKIKEFQFISPQGVLYKGVNIDAFAREFNLGSGNLHSLNKQRTNQLKGWTLPVEGIEYTNVINWIPKQKQESK